jgi:hypothetical protein
MSPLSATSLLAGMKSKRVYRILLAEDSPTISKMMLRMLAHQGHHVDHAAVQSKWRNISLVLHHLLPLHL